MDRRTFTGILAGGLVALRSVAEAQPSARIHRIGILLGGTADDAVPLLGALTEGLSKLGFVQGSNFVFETRHAGIRLDRLPDLAAELVRLRVDVIVTGSNPYAAAARTATATIPIVAVGSANPVRAGFVARLARPGGNITGLTIDASHDLFAKNLELLKEVVPRLSRVGVLRQADRTSRGIAELEATATRSKVALEVVDVHRLDELTDAFAAMSAKQVGGIVFVGSVFYLRRHQVAELALKHRLPAIQALKDYAQAGLLMSYGPDLLDLYRRAAGFVVKILGGVKPGELPIEQPVKFELVINLKTARGLGLTIPPSVLVRADEVIQ